MLPAHVLFDAASPDALGIDAASPDALGIDAASPDALDTDHGAHICVQGPSVVYVSGSAGADAL
jgi:hypothetical protein